MESNAEMNVVVVDDEEPMRVYLTETLESNGYGCKPFSNGAAALGWLASGKQSVDLLFSDINMSGMSGLHLLRTVRTVSPKLPFILISGACDLALAKEALRAGATDYLLKPVLPGEVLRLVATHTQTLCSAKFDAVKDALKRSLRSSDTPECHRADQLIPIFDALGIKRFETLQHSRRVSAFAVLIARGLDLDPQELRGIEMGALLHDIGKAGIPHNVLMKPGKLNNQEWVIMKMHPQIGADLLSSFPELNLEAEIVYAHHERFDGFGYPRQLSGKEIPLAARIFAVADTLDALTSDRCYREGRPLSAARAEIHRESGLQFDPAIVTLFDLVSDLEIEGVREQFPDM
jgi:putative nucleotidyltransferase with HDIG domain